MAKDPKPKGVFDYWKLGVKYIGRSIFNYLLIFVAAIIAEILIFISLLPTAFAIAVGYSTNNPNLGAALAIITLVVIVPLMIGLIGWHLFPKLKFKDWFA